MNDKQHPLAWFILVAGATAIVATVSLFVAKFPHPWNWFVPLVFLILTNVIGFLADILGIRSALLGKDSTSESSTQVTVTQETKGVHSSRVTGMKHIEIGEGPYVGRDVWTGGGDFVGRDKITLGENVQRIAADEIPKVTFQFEEDSTPFENQPGRYANHLIFTITNRGTKVIEELKLEFKFPNLEKIIGAGEWYRFHQRINSQDFITKEIHDGSELDYFLISYRSNTALLPGAKLGKTEIPRPCIIYAMERPDREKWIRVVKEINLSMEWILYTDLSLPQSGEILVAELQGF